MPPTVLSFIGGACVEFDLPDDEVDEVRSAFVFAETAHAGASPTVRYSRASDGQEIVRHDPLREFHPGLLVDVQGVIDDLHLTIALHAVDEVFIHAGVVAHEGAAIIVPGRSHTGKSTLVHELVRVGADYLSDEYARVTDDGSIRAYPRPIRLRTPTGRRLVEPDHTVAPGEPPLRPSLVVVTRYSPGAEFAPVRLSPARAALELFDNVVVARLAPARAMTAVAAIARAAVVVQTPRPDAATIAPIILEMARDLARTEPHPSTLELR